MEVQFLLKGGANKPLSAVLVTEYVTEDGDRIVLDSSMVSVPGKRRVAIRPEIHGPVSITATIIYEDRMLEAAAHIEVRHGRSGTGPHRCGG
jgi:hypothetical protein